MLLFVQHGRVKCNLWSSSLPQEVETVFLGSSESPASLVGIWRGIWESLKTASGFGACTRTLKLLAFGFPWYCKSQVWPEGAGMPSIPRVTQGVGWYRGGGHHKSMECLKHGCGRWALLGDEYVVLVKADGTGNLSLLRCLVSSPVAL